MAEGVDVISTADWQTQLLRGKVHPSINGNSLECFTVGF